MQNLIALSLTEQDLAEKAPTSGAFSSLPPVRQGL
jgi:hypothetical protein